MFNLGRENTGSIAKWWRNVDKQILILIISLFFLGLFFSFSSTSSIVAEKLDKETYFFFLKHLIFVLISLFLLVIISIQDKKTIIKFIPYLFFISFIFLLLVPFIGTEVKGSKRWLDFFIIPKFQPIELVKPLFILYVAKIIILNNKMNINNRYLISFFILLIISILLINQPDIGQTLLLVASWVLMIFVSGFNMFFLIILGTSSLLFIFFLIYFFPSKFGYIFLRIQSFLDPKTGDDFQTQRALDAIKQGGLTGQGMGEGILKDKVPEAHTDYIVAVISEEFGALFVLFIVILFLTLSYKVLNKVFYEKDEFLKLALVGLTSMLIVQTFIHIGVNTRLLPTTGMTLPFLSYGGSSLIGSSIIAGVILNFTRKDSTRYFENE
jgi:cell division protein FtsW